MTAWTTSFVDRMWQEPCSYCGARPKEHCVTKTGRKTHPHAARYYAVKEKQEKEAEENERG